MVQNSRYLKIGPGGRNCACCFPAPRSKDRRKQYRIAKHKATREAMRNAEEDMIDHWTMLEEAIADEYKQAYGDGMMPFDALDWMDDWENNPIEEDYDYGNDDTYYDHDDYNPKENDDLALLLLQAKWALRILNIERPNCGYDKLAEACQIAADERNDQ